MVSDLFFYQLMLVALVWLCVMLHWAWPSDTAACPTALEPPPPLPKRKREPTPFAGLTHKPHCDACEHTTDSRPPPQLRPRVLCLREGAAARSTPPPIAVRTRIAGVVPMSMREKLIFAAYSHCAFNHNVAKEAMIWLKTEMAMIWLKTHTRVDPRVSTA